MPTEEAQEINWTAYSWENCLKKLHLDVDLVFFGDSITAGSNFQDYFEDVSICNLGLSGDGIFNMMERVGMIAAVKPEKVFIMAGINDIPSVFGHVDFLLDAYESLLDKIEEACPNANIYIESLLPVNGKMKDSHSNEDIALFNTLLEEMAGERGLVYIDLYSLYAVDGDMPEKFTPDGLHLNQEGYTIWAEVIADYVY